MSAGHTCRSLLFRDTVSLSDEWKWQADRHLVVERSESDDLRQPVKPVP